MKAIKIYNQNSKYFMEDLETQTVTELTQITKDGISLILPANSANRQYCSLKKADKGIVMDFKETREMGTTNTTSTKKPKIDLTQYYTPEEKAQIEKLQTKIDKINEEAMARAQKDIKMAELTESLKALDPESLKSIVATLMGGEA